MITSGWVTEKGLVRPHAIGGRAHIPDLAKPLTGLIMA
jgi:hypothetical protein